MISPRHFLPPPSYVRLSFCRTVRSLKRSRPRFHERQSPKIFAGRNKLYANIFVTVPVPACGDNPRLRRLPCVFVHQHQRLIHHHFFFQLNQTAELTEDVRDRAHDEFVTGYVLTVHAYWYRERHPARSSFFPSSITRNRHVRPWKKPCLIK
jgi:hypothetical protein